jgi:hypothetical protein
MALAYFKSKAKKTGEKRLGSVAFNVYKLNHRPKPRKKNRIKIVSCFSEFGCETLGVLYCIPRLLRRFPGMYVIAMGWHGREYFYRHLVDEYWELKEEYMWLRDYTRAFHHVSRNLKRVEEEATVHGDVIPAAALGKYAVANMCRTCGMFWHEWRRRTEECPKCGSTVLIRSIFTDVEDYKPRACPLPRPSQEALDWAKTIVKPNSVGVFARGRKTYGRNLEPDFYVKLIKLLEDMGHNVIWLGEKQSTQPCPVDHVLDFSRMPESQNLERTLAIICNLDFTVQFWTASTRLAGMMGVPFVLFESPEQINVSYSGLCGAQEGKRLELTSFGPKKVVLAHFKSVYEDPDRALEVFQRAVGEMKEGNYEEIIGMVEDEWFTKILQTEHREMLT